MTLKETSAVSPLATVVFIYFFVTGKVFSMLALVLNNDRDLFTFKASGTIAGQII